MPAAAHADETERSGTLRQHTGQRHRTRRIPARDKTATRTKLIAPFNTIKAEICRGDFKASCALLVCATRNALYVCF
ncbi:hypothetical protein JM93_02415 [Roseibium hamelinense]|uniref:Uncharacterized protein n=1 Tax=Roseibium hamelinense TaxID=150831 RepID=A0A562T2V3_9HYPH|nr:hypothetical protein JM93_02415 [Roseibium hamelinense]